MLSATRFFTPTLGFFCLSLTACGPDWGSGGPERSETSNIELDQSEEVRVDLRMGAGELRVHGGCRKPK